MLITSLTGLLLLTPLSSGLEVKVLRPGTGPGATKSDILTMTYKGTLSDGKVFDTNVGRAPFAFRLGAGQVIDGWEQGLTGAKSGSKMKLVVPPELAYAHKGFGPVPPGATVTFELEVLRIDRPSDKPKLKIFEIKKGRGPAVGPESDVKVNFVGKFVNGVIFDGTKVKPFTFRMGVSAVCRGFEETVRTMRVGGKRKVIVPFQYGFGGKGKQPYIPRWATLIYEIEVLDILK